MSPGATPPVVEQAIEPKSAADRERLTAALAALAAEDPSFTAVADSQSGQMIIKGTGELHLDLTVDLLKRVHNLDINIGAPQVAYRETVAFRVEVSHVHAKVFGGGGEFAKIVLVFEPGAPGSGFTFENQAIGMLTDYLRGVEQGLAAAMESGPLAGFPLIDFKVTLIDWTYHDIDSSPAAFAQAAQGAVQQLRDRKALSLLEPIMRLEVVTPHDYAADVLGDLESRRGKLQDVEPNDDHLVLVAFVPMSNLFGYVSQLRSFTEGHAQHTMTFDHYAAVPMAGPDPDPRFPQAMAMRA